MGGRTEVTFLVTKGARKAGSRIGCDLRSREEQGLCVVLQSRAGTTGHHHVDCGELTFSVIIGRHIWVARVLLNVGGEREASRWALRRVMEGIHALGVKGGIQTEIISELVSEPHTIREIVNLLYDRDRDDAGFETYYMRVRRALKFLEAKGLVSSSLFGKEKTYRLTRHGVLSISSIAAGVEPPKVLSKIDLLLLVTTFFLGLLTYLGSGSPQLVPDIPSGTLSDVFLVVLGISFGRVLSILLEVR